MVDIIGYVIVLVISVGIATLLLKFAVMPLTDFYARVNIIIYVVLILGIFLFFMPKVIVSQSVYKQVGLSCRCTGYLYTNDYGGCMRILTDKDLLLAHPDIQKNGCIIKKECFGIIFSCTKFEDFKATAIRDIEVCNVKNDFYQSADACFENAAKEIASHAASGDSSFGFEKSNSYCQRMSEPGRTQCINYIKLLEGGGVLFG